MLKLHRLVLATALPVAAFLLVISIAACDEDNPSEPSFDYPVLFVPSSPPIVRSPRAHVFVREDKSWREIAVQDSWLEEHNLLSPQQSAAFASDFSLRLLSDTTFQTIPRNGDTFGPFSSSRVGSMYSLTLTDPDMTIYATREDSKLYVHRVILLHLAENVGVSIRHGSAPWMKPGTDPLTMIDTSFHFYSDTDTVAYRLFDEVLVKK